MKLPHSRQQHGVDRACIGRASVLAAIHLGALAMLVGCGSGSEGSVAVTPEAVATETASVLATATSVPTSGTATPTNVIQEAPCFVLPDELCGQGEVLEFEINGEVHLMLGFTLPVGTLIHSPIAGVALTVTISDTAPVRGNQVSVNDELGSPDAIGFAFFGDVQPLTASNVPVRVGDQIASIQDTGILNEGTNLIISTTPLGEARLRQLFPYIGDSQARRIKVAQSPQGHYIGVPILEEGTTVQP